jgi:hypothetical protein
MPKPKFFIYNGFWMIEQSWFLLENWKVYDFGKFFVYNTYNLETQTS